MCGIHNSSMISIYAPTEETSVELSNLFDTTAVAAAAAAVETRTAWRETKKMCPIHWLIGFRVSVRVTAV